MLELSLSAATTEYGRVAQLMAGAAPAFPPPTASIAAGPADVMRLAATLQAALPADFQQSFASWMGGSMAGGQQQQQPPLAWADPYTLPEDWQMPQAPVEAAAGADPSQSMGDTMRALGQVLAQNYDALDMLD